MSPERSQTNNPESLHFNALVEGIKSDLSNIRTEEEADRIIQKGFQSVLDFIHDEFRSGKVIDKIISDCREELKAKGINI